MIIVRLYLTIYRLSIYIYCSTIYLFTERNPVNLERLSQKKSAIIGLGQSILGLSYIAFIVTILQNTSRVEVNPPEYVIAMAMLTLLVLSATTMGLFFLGMPLYLVLKGNWPKALQIVGFTLLFSFIIMATILSVVLAVGF